MFIEQLKIKNFKCFDNEDVSLKFSIPDGKTCGKGLNIFVGENNVGKSTVFEVIDFLRDNTNKDLNEIKNKNSKGNDEMFVEITFTGNITSVIENFSQNNKKDVFKKYVYKNDGSNDEYFKLLRSSKDIKVIQLWNNGKSKLENEVGIDAPLKKLFETNFVWSDTNPNDQASFGSTTICGNLLKEIIKKFEETEDYTKFSSQFHKTFNDEESGLRKELKIIEERTQKIFSEQFSDAEISFHFEELKIDSFFKNTKIKVDDGISTYMEEKGSGMQRSVALALLQVYTEKLIKHPDNNTISKPFFLFIDEPELCLHPQAQLKLFKAILELSKTKQIFIATHSPYFFKDPAFRNARIFLFKKDENCKVEVQNIEDLGIFPWSPSWGEISYCAYNLPTVEFHNELYGYLQEKSGKTRISDFDNYLKNDKNVKILKDYQGNGKNEESTLCTFVRNQIHHPENTNNKKYTNEDLKESIKIMIGLLKQEDQVENLS